MTKRQIRTVETLAKLADEIREELDADNFDIVASLLGDVAFKAILYAVKKKGLTTRRTWAQVRPLVVKLSPPLKKDYTNVVEDARALDKSARYAEDSWECDEEEVRDLAERVIKLVDDVRNMAP